MLLSACDAADANANVRWLLTAGAVGENAAAAYLAWTREGHFTGQNGATTRTFATGQPMLRSSELVAV